MRLCKEIMLSFTRHIQCIPSYNSYLQLVREFKNRVPIVIVITLLTLCGAVPRLFFALSSKYPLHDGGLFYVMIQDIQAADFTLPIYTSYNADQLPFAYPPLGFFLAAALENLGPWSIMDILRLLPPIVSTLTIPAFYLFGRSILKDNARAIFACMAFATIPTVFDWSIMGGGLTRSLGFLFSIIALHQLQAVLQLPQIWRSLTAALAFSAVVLSHPAAAWFVIYSAGLLLIYSPKTSGWAVRVTATIAVTVLITMPWFLTIVSRHGIMTLFAVSDNAFTPKWSFFPLILLQFTGEPVLKVWAVIGLVGLLICIRDRRALLPMWLFVIALAQGRGWPAYIEAPFAMVIGIGLEQILHILSSNNLSDILHGLAPKLGLSYIMIVSLISAFIASPKESLTQDQADAMAWIAGNTPPNSAFAIVTGVSNWSDDAIAEWFPALTKRISLTTPQGYEWKRNEFSQRQECHQAMQLCVSQTSDCLDDWAHASGEIIEYVYIVIAPTNSSSTLVDSLALSTEYKQIYGSSEVLIFAHRPNSSTPRVRFSLSIDSESNLIEGK